MPDAPAFIPIGVDPPAPLGDTAAQRAMSCQDLHARQIAQRLGDLGIAIDRLTCPRLIEQLLAAGNRLVDTVLCGVVDVDPAARLNAAVARRFGQDVRLGLRVAVQAASAGNSTLLIDSNAPNLSIGGRRADGVKVVTRDLVYPHMHASLLLKALYRRKLPVGQIPTEQGVLMIDAAAAWMIARLAADEPSMGMPLMIRDDRSNRSILALAAPELPLGEILQSLQLTLDHRSLVLVGPRLLKQPADLHASAGQIDPVIHLCAAERPAASEPCVRCNWCAEVCPTGVLPMGVLEAVQFDNAAAARRAGLSRCISCGLCDYVCPSRLPLLPAIRKITSRLSPGAAFG